MAKVRSDIARGRGRPPIEPSQRKRNNVTVRVRDDTKGRLTAAAALNGRSLSEEIEARLERSLADEETRYEDFGGRGGFEFLRVLGVVASQLGRQAGRPNWWRDQQTYEAVTTLWKALMKVFEPKGPARSRRYESYVAEVRLEPEIGAGSRGKPDADDRAVSIVVAGVKL